jgi:hypothetical protein
VLGLTGSLKVLPKLLRTSSGFEHHGEMIGDETKGGDIIFREGMRTIALEIQDTDDAALASHREIELRVCLRVVSNEAGLGGDVVGQKRLPMAGSPTEQADVEALPVTEGGGMRVSAPRRYEDEFLGRFVQQKDGDVGDVEFLLDQAAGFSEHLGETLRGRSVCHCREQMRTKCAHQMSGAVPELSSSAFALDAGAHLLVSARVLERCAEKVTERREKGRTMLRHSTSSRARAFVLRLPDIRGVGGRCPLAGKKEDAHRLLPRAERNEDKETESRAPDQMAVRRRLNSRDFKDDRLTESGSLSDRPLANRYTFEQFHKGVRDALRISESKLGSGFRHIECSCLEGEAPEKDIERLSKQALTIPRVRSSGRNGVQNSELPRGFQDLERPMENAFGCGHEREPILVSR